MQSDFGTAERKAVGHMGLIADVLLGAALDAVEDVAGLELSDEQVEEVLAKLRAPRKEEGRHEVRLLRRLEDAV